MKVIEFKDICKVYGTKSNQTKVLENINFSIEENELVVILGASGAGKSTILNILGGLDKPTSGSFFFKDSDITKLNEKELTKYRAKNIGFIFQFYNLIQNLTIYENIDIVNSISNTKYDTNKVIEQTMLTNLKNRFPKDLSGGEQQRTSIARALIKEPLLILSDEPTGALDTKTGVEILKILKGLTKKGHIVVIVTHNLLIKEIADKIIYVKNGKVENIVINEHIKEVEEVLW
ncbi:MAG: ABC transporter ATP-binding protein [Acholeplasmatales bacterium]|jgi:putative ABC transport system ATP-binding protein|nr:ABC transporter ATP-binding protein [Acholeplasmatales bacterium]